VKESVLWPILQQAREYATSSTEASTNFDVDKFERKLAQLIVEECITVCADRGKHHDGLYSAWASDCSERIGKHFGVET